MRMIGFRSGAGGAEVAGIEGEEGVVAIGPGEAVVGGSSNLYYLYILIYILIL